MSNIFDKKLIYLIKILLAVELLSWLSFGQSFWSLGVMIILGLATFGLAWWRLEYGLYILLTELIIGGKGYMFAFEFGGFSVSIRLVLFIAVFLAWLIGILWHKDWQWLRQPTIWLICGLGVMVGLGVAIGWFKGYPLADIFFDANGYFYFGLVGAIVAAGLRFKPMMQIMLAGLIDLSLKTVFTLAMFGHGLAQLQDPFYKWIRDTGVGEIAMITDSLYRIFFQSHIYILLAVILLLAMIFSGRTKTKNYFYFLLVLVLGVFTLLSSQSRSFWLAGLLAWFLMLSYLIYQRFSWRKIAAYILFLPTMILVSHLIINLLINDWQVNLFSARLGEGTSQAGVSSRQAQISPALESILAAPVFGQGFGHEISYQSSDPRILTEANPEGWYATSALELGYLDLAIDLGLVGVVIYFGLLAYLLKAILRSDFSAEIKLGLILSLLALFTVHIFSPYLNHPLGIGYILVVIGLLANNYSKLADNMVK